MKAVDDQADNVMKKYPYKNEEENCEINLKENMHDVDEEFILGIPENLQVIEKSLLERAFLCLEDGDFYKADNLLERVLDINPKNSKAYIGKLMVDLKINIETNIPSASNSFLENKNYKRAVQFANSEYLATIIVYNKSNIEKIMNEPKEKIYQNALSSKSKALSEFEYRDMAKLLRSIIEYKDSEILANEFDNLADELVIKKQKKYYPEAEEFLKIGNAKYASLNYFLAGNFERSYKIFNLNSLISAGKYRTAVIYKNKIFITNQIVPCFVSFGMSSTSQFGSGNFDDIFKEAFGDFTGKTEQFDFHSYYSLELFDALKSVSLGSEHTVILNKYGIVVTIGENQNGQCNTNNWRDIVSISAGEYYTVGLKKDGTVVATGLNDEGQCNVEHWKNIVEISSGANHTLGVNEDGTVIATGSNDNGQCNVEKWRDIISVSAGYHFSIGLKKDGTVVATGLNDKGQCNVKEWIDIISVSAGFMHTLGLKQNSIVVATGLNDDFQCNTKEWKDIIAISAGTDHSIGLKKDGSFITAGCNGNGQCNLWTFRMFKDNDSKKYIKNFEEIKIKLLDLEKQLPEKEEIEKKLKEQKDRLSDLKFNLFGVKVIERKEVKNKIDKLENEFKEIKENISKTRYLIEEMQ